MVKKISSPTKRNSSIELLRIISIMGVVLLHYNNEAMGGGFRYVKDYSVNQIYLFFIESVFIGAVNLFIMISGYFLSSTQKRSFGKILNLILQVSLINLAFYLYGVYKGGDSFSFGSLFYKALPLNYFLILYSALYIISPYINILLNKLNKQAFLKLLITAFAVFSLWTIIWDYFSAVTGSDVSSLSTVSMHGSLSGYTIVNFCLSYLLGAYIRKHSPSISTFKLLFGLAILIMAVCVLSYREHFLGINSPVSWNYNNPLVFGIAASAFMLFLRFSFSSKIINEIAGATFTCFLINTIAFSKADIPSAVSGNLFQLVLNQLIVVFATYIIAYVIYKVYSLCTGWFFKLIKPLTDKVNISVNIE